MSSLARQLGAALELAQNIGDPSPRGDHLGIPDTQSNLSSALPALASGSLPPSASQWDLFRAVSVHTKGAGSKEERR